MTTAIWQCLDFFPPQDTDLELPVVRGFQSVVDPGDENGRAPHRLINLN